MISHKEMSRLISDDSEGIITPHGRHLYTFKKYRMLHSIATREELEK